MNEEQKKALEELIAEAASFGECGGSWQTAQAAVQAALRGEPWKAQAQSVYDLAVAYLKTMKLEN